MKELGVNALKDCVFIKSIILRNGLTEIGGKRIL